MTSPKIYVVGHLGMVGSAIVRTLLALDKAEHVLYDLKYLLPASDSDLRL